MLENFFVPVPRLHTAMVIGWKREPFRKCLVATGIYLK